MSPESTTKPFVGLRPFRTEESLLFFGRREQIADLLERLHQARFLAIIGSSGCGKSSLIRAGLIPRLAAGFLVEERNEWIVATMTPGEAPLGKLAECFGLTRQTLSEEGASSLFERLASQPGASARSCLLLVDQFEEIFRFATSPQQLNEAADFVGILLSLATQRSFPIFVVITMRSDFLGDCDRFYGLPEALNRSHYLVPRLSRQQRRESIEGPVRLFRQKVSPQLVDRLLNDLGDELDQLPVMQHVLLRTWEYWQKQEESRPLDIPDYLAVGGVQEALARDAESAMDGLSREDRDLAAQMFQALTDVDVSNRRVRRPVKISELEAVTGASRERIMNIIERFRGGDRSFLHTQSQPGSTDVLVDISHESLIRQWETLKKWTDDEAESKRIYLDYLINAVHYKQSLLHDSNLQVALDWRARRKPTPAWACRYDARFKEAMLFLDESREAALRETREKARMVKRTRVMAWGLLVMAVIAFVGASAYGGWIRRGAQAEVDRAQGLVGSAKVEVADAQAKAAGIQRQAQLDLDAAQAVAADADEKARVAAKDAQQASSRAQVALREAQQAKSEKAQTLLVVRMDQAAEEAKGVLALEAMLLDPGKSAHPRDILMKTLEGLPPPGVRRAGHENRVNVMAASSDGQRLATGGNDHKVIVWDAEKQSVLRTLDLGVAVTKLVFNPQGNWLAAGGSGKIIVWNVSDSVQVTSINETPLAFAFSPDGREFAVSLSSRVKRFDTTTPSPWRESQTSTSLTRVRALAYDGARLVSLANDKEGSGVFRGDQRISQDCSAFRMDVGDIVAACSRGLYRFLPDGSSDTFNIGDVQDFFINRDAQLIIALTRSRTGANQVQVFRGTSTEAYLRLLERPSAFVAPERGRWMATGDLSGAVTFWRLEPASVATQVDFKPAIADLTFSHDEKWLAIAGRDGDVGIFDPSSGRPIRSFMVRDRLYRPMFSSDGSLLALLGETALHIIQTATWTPAGPAIPISPNEEFSFAFSERSEILIVAQTGKTAGMLQRFSTRPFTLLSSVSLPGLAEVQLSRDKEWIVAHSGELTRANRRTQSYFQTSTGRSVQLAEFPRNYREAIERPAEIDDAEPQLISLLPRDDSELSGDSRGGPWEVDNSVVTERITEATAFTFPEPATHYAISRKGTWIGTHVSENPKALVWPWTATELLKRACEILPRNLTASEWDKLLGDLGLGERRATCPNLPLP